MNKLAVGTFSLLVLPFFFSACQSNSTEEKIPQVSEKTIVAETPPMGWNSFDAYDCRINEDEFKKTVDYMAENLLPFGYEYAVIDYIWWHPEPGNWDTPRRKGHPDIRYKENGEPLHPEYITMDEYGRLLPSVERFPSAADGNGFKAVADYVHSKGMKFGIHIMRGIHRYAAFLNTPIKGTEYHAKDISETWDVCNWCNHMWGVDASQPGAQEYYNSLFELYAAWGVDFIKADDTMYPPYHRGEIEMIHNAIENCGRPMVLSLSCGEAPLGMANHLKENANMWRVSADFWDRWEDLKHNFDLLNAWSSHTGLNTWPDGDMLPIGKISLDDRPHGPERMTNFTPDEQYTLMSLWAMARSPLMIGADLLSMDDFTLALLTNPEVIKINQHSTGNRQVWEQNGIRVWMAKDPETGDPYLAMFNLSDNTKELKFELEVAELRGQYKVQEIWTGKDLGTIEKTLSEIIPAHGVGLYKLSMLD